MFIFLHLYYQRPYYHNEFYEDIENIKYVTKNNCPGYLWFSSYYFSLLEIHEPEKCAKDPDKWFSEKIHFFSKFVSKMMLKFIGLYFL